MDELISSFEDININKDWQEFSRLHNGIVGNNNFQSLYYYLHEIKKYYTLLLSKFEHDLSIYPEEDREEWNNVFSGMKVFLELYDDKNYVITLDSEKDDIQIKSKNYDIFSNLINRIDPNVEPVIVKRLTKLIFEENREIAIGHVIFDRNGYRSKKRFRNKSVYWRDTIYNATINNGEVILLEDENDCAKEFTTISMRENNASVIPSLIDTLYKEFHMRQQN